MDFQTPDSEAVPSGDFSTPADEAVQSGFESAARGALRNIPLAQQAAATVAPINPWSDKATYGAELQHLTDAAETGKAQNPGAYYTGAAAGTLAPLLIPGVGEVAEAARGAGMAGGAINAAAQSVSDVNLTKPTGRDVENTALSAVLGGALGKVFGGAKPGVSGAAEDAAPAAATEAAAPAAAESPLATVAQQAIPMPSLPAQAPAAPRMAIPIARQAAPDFVPSADRIYASNLAQGMGGTPRQLMKVFGKKDPVSSMVKIGNWMETAGPKGTNLNGLLDRPGELLEKVDSIHDSSGKVIGGIIDKMGAGAALDRPGLEMELFDFAQKTADPATEARIMKLISTSENLGKKGLNDFDILQQVKGMAGKQIAKDPEMSEVYGHLADRLSDLVDAHGAALKDPALTQAYTKAKLDYANSSRLLPMLRYAEAKDLVGGPAGHHTLRGLLSSIFNMGTAMTGLPPAEQLGKNVMLKAAPVARGVVNAAAGARAALPGAAAAAGGGALSRAAQLELANALQSKFGKGSR